YSFRPAPYPDGGEPEHIHMTVKEPHKNAYYIDNLTFDDDPLLTDQERETLEGRGGTGIAYPVLKDGILEVRRDIILGLHIPDYE
ncbi:MAG: intradiol ring-cleavage dioxygenase, partial [Bacteroidota bacterium]